MSVKIDSLIDSLLQDDTHFDNIDDDIEYYSERIIELNKQIKSYKKYSKNANEHDKKLIHCEILELSMRITEYTKLRDNLTPKQRSRGDSDLMFQFED